MSVSDKKPLYNASNVNIDTKSLGLSLISVFICTLYESAQKYNALTHSDTCTIASSIPIRVEVYLIPYYKIK